MKTIIFSANNDRGEPLIDIAGRQGEIWTARRNTKLKEGDTVRLIRKYRGKHEYEGVVAEIELIEDKKGWLIWDKFVKYCAYSGFVRATNWLHRYIELTNIQSPRKVYFIHITNIKPYHAPNGERSK